MENSDSIYWKLGVIEEQLTLSVSTVYKLKSVVCFMVKVLVYFPLMLKVKIIRILKMLEKIKFYQEMRKKIFLILN